MNKRKLAFLSGPVAMLTLALALALTLPAVLVGSPVAASAQAANDREVMRLRVVPVSSIDRDHGFVASNDDYARNGKKVGSDVTTCRLRKHHKGAVCDVGLALAGGMITITFHPTAKSNRATGRVTGGTGEYSGVCGSVHIVERSSHANARIVLRRSTCG
jgi:hypothetical protein